jgi:hypothetical protein
MKHQDCTVGWICALLTEVAAAVGMLDSRHDPLSQPYRERTTAILRTDTFIFPYLDVMDHVEDVHLSKQPAGQNVVCHHPVCKSHGLVLNNIMHFKNYVATVHGISLRA